MREHQRHRQQHYGTGLEEGGQVVARGEQQPHRQDGGTKSIGHDKARQHQRREVEQPAQARVVIHPAAAHEREEHQHHAEQRALEHPPRPPHPQVKTHERRGRDGCQHRERRPRAVLHDIHDHQPEHGAQDHHDEECADKGCETAERPEFIVRHPSEAAAVAAYRQQQDSHVLHTAAEHRSHQDPQRSGQITELRGECRTHERPGTGDGGEVMTEHDGAMRRHEVAAVIQTLRRSRAGGIDRQHLRGDPRAVEAQAEQVSAHRRGEDPQRIDRLVPVQGDCAHGDRAENRKHRGDELSRHASVLRRAAAAARVRSGQRCDRDRDAARR